MTATVERPGDPVANRDNVSGPVERATGARDWSTFPPEWGVPEGRAYSKEREDWIRSHIDTPTARYRLLAKKAERLAAIAEFAQRHAELNAKKR